MKLSSVFTRGVVTAPPTAPLGAVAALMFQHNVGAVVIEEDRRPVGIVTDRDLAEALGFNGQPIETPAQKVMTRHVLAIPEDTDVFAATQYMRKRQVRRLPVVDAADHLVGIVTLDDLLGLLGREFANLAESIHDEVRVREPSLPRTGEPHDLRSAR
ncbi:CBS domain-containing protein [Limnoglobus roseus]|uniref:CBS domain-containing protein n=1 Tax=Limnoglobus roseus TaxID=2598579 RepID=A0A5C1AG59_9BACT|nr:CBS domain-containing protein [Limnoglobus roseus]QEL16732.1 CBS domain-containing protein [Limnoglobus roseus]